MRLSGLDLNLLVALDALVQERSVTRAAERLGLSQPTLSASLARLRRHFDDQLLYRAGNAYHLTPLGLDLAQRTGLALDAVGRIFASQATVDPSTSTREFTVLCSDYTAAVAGAALSAALARGAPHASLHLRQTDVTPYTDDLDRLRTVDGLLMPHGFLRGLPHLDLYRDTWACVVSADNTAIGDEITLDDLGRLPWVVTYRGPRWRSTAVRNLAALGVEIRVQAAVDNFLAVPHLVAGTDRVAMVPRRLVALTGPSAGVRALAVPFDAGTLVEALWWHPDFERDAEHAWLRGEVAAVAAGLADRLADGLPEDDPRPSD